MLIIVVVIPKARVIRDYIELDTIDEAGAIIEGIAVGEKKVRGYTYRRL